MINALRSKENDCRSCYKCIRNCPVKSISFDNGQAKIEPNDCILCGKCYLVCPQDCKEIRDDTAVAKSLLSAHKCVASLAPSFLSAFPNVSFETMKEALLSLGFKDVEETAIGATIVKKAYDELLEEGTRDIVISTCCHSVNLLIQKKFPSCAKYLAPVMSPMQAHGAFIKKRYPDRKVIFLGPCISKKNEIETYPGHVDCVLTFLELKKLLSEKGIEVKADKDPLRIEKSKARLFPLEGGILKTMEKKAPEYAYLAISGTDEIMSALKDIENGKVHRAFIEMSTCHGSCINGPAINKGEVNALRAYIDTERSAGRKDFEVEKTAIKDLSLEYKGFKKAEIVHSEEDIKRVLRKIGKHTRKDELNCASCGYPTCRAKAIAVLEGKASLEMCLPYLMEKAKSFSDSIVHFSSNAIVVLDEAFMIQLANPALASLVGVEDPKDLSGKSVNAIMEPDLFGLALGGIPIQNKKVFLAEYGKHLEATITYDERFHILIGVFRDVTKDERVKENEREVAERTAMITSSVIEKNMRTVQEIASLLGETTAETKLALLQLQGALEKGKVNGD